MSQIEVVAIVKAKPGRGAEVAAAMKACEMPSRAESTNKLYTPHRDLDDPDTFVFIESWESREALKAHMETSHFKEMAKKLEPLMAAPFQVHILKPL
ncbi:putative quinol monooxygenase [Acetobacter fallax]|uniref:Antibiotic biosynthesis monooxygenase n=1 Tax=Acetobacter fallax TaxID=1737473 RepID=A0ABX0K877_9PROT|nr:putative quinol monooxygenase [Acetobacter fallax]NHO32446.1 antibiotic biosynthesis monooxygenase [Acetobacter fallax]NHO36006.1 antibiotic biosynthesis monooxygenase [Acetobacter fallax]